MLVLVALWAFAEATLFFIVADVPISALALRRGWLPSALAAGLAALCAAVGGLALMAWARADPAAAHEAVARLPAIDPALIERAAVDWRAGGAVAMIEGAFRGVPYKLYVLAAADEGTAAARFFAASLIARLPRFLLVAAFFSWLGPRLRRRLSALALWTLFAAGWSVFYAAYFWASR